MNTEKLIALAKQYRQLQDERRDLDFRQATWAREAISCFSNEDRFVVWCQSDLALTAAAAHDLCLRGRAARIVTDAKTWSRLGGMRQIRAVEPLAKKDQVNILEVAKATGRAVRTLVAERFPTVRPAVTSTPVAAQMKDIERLAKFIASHLDDLPELPSDVSVIVGMYAPIARRKRAA